MLKRRSYLLLVAIGLLMASCSNPSSSSSLDGSSSTPSSSGGSISESSSSSGSSTTSSSDITIGDLLDDDNAMGTYSEEDNENRYPDEESAALIAERKRILSPGETYVETYENDMVHTKISPCTVDDGASCSITDESGLAINGKSLYLDSEGTNAGVQFNGMKFQRSGTYDISFSYRVVSGTTGFFLQFRSRTQSVSRDVYIAFRGEIGKVLTQSGTISLYNYADYYLMLFPALVAGAVVIDDISITRKADNPAIDYCEIEGSMTVGSTLTYSYAVVNKDSLKGPITHVWFTSIDRDGTDRTVIDTTSDELVLTDDYIGKFIGISLIIENPYLGYRFDAYSSSRVNGVSPDIGITINLKENESFTEDFESDCGEKGNILFKEGKGANAYITDKEADVLSGSKSLYFSSSGNYSAITMSGIYFEASAIYTISFDYRFEEKGDGFYVQLRSANPASGDYSNDKYVGMDMSAITVGATQRFTGEFRLDAIKDYYLMLFPSSSSSTVIIDNMTITRNEGTTKEVTDVELAVGETISEDFDQDAFSLGFDISQVPTSGLTTDTEQSIDGRSYYFESSGSYRCLFINKGLAYTANATYKVSFDYKVLAFCDTAYFQFNCGSSTVFDQFGSKDDIGTVRSYEHEFALGSATNYVMQIFPGAGTDVTKIVFDNIIIERTK